jgi:hypothetical protein
MKITFHIVVVSLHINKTENLVIVGVIVLCFAGDSPEPLSSLFLARQTAQTTHAAEAEQRFSISSGEMIGN